MITLYLVVTISFASAYDLMNNWTEEPCFSRIEELDSLVREMKEEVKKTRDLLSSLKVLRKNLYTGQATIDPDARMSQTEKEKFYDERIRDADGEKLKETYDKKMKRLSFLNFLYFSSVTITTLGYGDIYPTKYYSKILVVFEVFVGLFLVLIYLGVIMTQYRPSEACR